MDLGLEGGFAVHEASINEKTNPDFIEKSGGNGWVKLQPTRYRIVFANDILKEARTAWTHHFAKYGYPAEVFRQDSVVDLVKRGNVSSRKGWTSLRVVFLVRISVWRVNAEDSIPTRITGEES